jgi:hypothetical protein
VAILGALLVLVAWLSVQRAVFVPREQSSRAARCSTELVAAVTLATARRLRGGARERVLGVCTPVALFVMVWTWLVTSTAGFALLAWGIAAVPFNASALGSFFMLRSAGVALAAVAWLSTALLLAAFTTHLMRVTDAYARRERLVIKLAAQATRPSDAEKVLAGYLRTTSSDHLDTVFTGWADWMADVQGTHLSYPALPYYRAAGELSWTGAAVIVLDCAALTQACTPGWAPTGTSSLLTVGSRCLQRIATQLSIKLPEVAASHQGRETCPFHGTVARIRQAGLPVERDEDMAQAAFQRLRIQYAPFANAIQERLLYEPPKNTGKIRAS